MGIEARDRVVVIGAGMGGLAAAIDLARAGREVDLFEGACAPGGKLRPLSVAGTDHDAGPTVLTMRWVFDELFAASGAPFDASVTLLPARILARHIWGPHEVLDLSADLDETCRAIAAFSGAAQGRRYADFCARAARIYDTLEEPFLRAQRPMPWTLAHRVGLARLPELWRIAPMVSLWRALAEHFPDGRLHQLFGRYATYCGSSPFEAPATLMLIAHVERVGVWRVEGGMHRLGGALADRARALGATVHYQKPIAHIEAQGGRVTGVRLADGTRYPASAVVYAGDVNALAGGMLGAEVSHAAPPVGVEERSLSAITWNLTVPVGGRSLAHHTVLFSKDYAREFDQLFRQRRVPDDPTVYVCAQDRDDAAASVGLNAPERLFCLINAPARGDGPGPDSSERARWQEQLFERLQRAGIELGTGRHAPVQTVPQDFAARYPGSGGALYGRASHGWRATFKRPGSRTGVAGLYLAGGTVHPGPGVPMAALSGRLAASALLWDSTSRAR